MCDSKRVANVIHYSTIYCYTFFHTQNIPSYLTLCFTYETHFIYSISQIHTVRFIHLCEYVVGFFFLFHSKIAFFFHEFYQIHRKLFLGDIIFKYILFIIIHFEMVHLNISISSFCFFFYFSLVICEIAWALNPFYHLFCLLFNNEI